MFKFLGKLSDIVSSLAVAAIVMITILAVFMRWLLNDPLMWSEEVLIICYIWLVMIGAASAAGKRMHVSIDAITSLFPEKIQLVIAVFTHIMAIIALSIFGYLGYELSIIAEDKITPIIGVSYYYIDLSVPIGASIMVLFSIQHLLEDMSKLIKGDKPCQ
ncbi:MULTISPECIES: TRAP transporter small permease [Providencia]|uniref:TRAP transporter small permease protein n=2 Tax=Providencia TaxID=586 RepID=A0AA42K184_9GAMM|nr:MULTISPECIES: TRAP transporter small permease [Providencia]HCI96191.1 TRAP transporter small permease [Providencia sp.]APC12469.1 Sialic acid TRAP transporter permease protein SiaT [Providencia rettgeri]AVL75895.1 TRAP transporter small permease [Providencia rettgeri]EIL1982504.1 TRAP transporter small permease [Providencia rettgeri]EIU7557193.1 TRAP transporter small permease [Providencia rettgeri]